MIHRTKFDHLAVESKRAAVAGKSEVLNREILASVLSILDKSGLGSNLKTKGKHQWTKIMSGITSFSFSRLKIDPNHPQSELWTGKPLPSALLISTLEVLPRNYGGNGMTYIETTNMSDFQVTKSEISIINQDLYLIFMSYIWIHLDTFGLLYAFVISHSSATSSPGRHLSLTLLCRSMLKSHLVDPKIPSGSNCGNRRYVGCQASTFILESKATSKTSYAERTCRFQNWAAAQKNSENGNCGNMMKMNCRETSMFREASRKLSDLSVFAIWSNSSLPTAASCAGSIGTLWAGAIGVSTSTFENWVIMASSLHSGKCQAGDWDINWPSSKVCSEKLHILAYVYIYIYIYIYIYMYYIYIYI